MSMLNHLTAFADRTFRVQPNSASRYAVSLIDRRNGKPHAIAGVPLVIMCADPQAAAHELLRNRDPELWDTFVERLDQKGALQ